MRQVLLRIWRLLTPQQKRRLLLLQLVSIFMAFSTLAGIAAVMPFFAVLASPSLIHSNRWLAAGYEFSGVASDRAYIVLLGVALIAVTAISSVVTLLGKLAMTRFGFWVANDFRILLFNEYLNRRYLFHARTNSATLVNNTNGQVDRITNGLLIPAINLVTNVITVATIIGAIVLVNPMIALGTAVLLGGGYGIVYVAVRRRLLAFGKVMTEAGQARQKALQEGFGGIKEILVLQTRRVFQREFERQCWRISKTSADAQVVKESPRYLLESIAIVGMVGVALVLSGGTSSDGAWLAQLSFLALAAYRLLPALQTVFHQVASIRVQRDALDRIAPDLEQGRTRQASMADPLPDPVWRSRPSKGIELREIVFRYGPSLEPALRGLSLDIPSGATVGFVGASGSGKTTTADLLLGLLVPESGSMAVDGETIDDANRERWQSALAYVPQHIFLTDGTIAENIAFGVDRAAIDMERVREAGRMAQLDEFVQGLEQGYDTPIGERGVRLSGGQRQRIGIARALYRQASVLVFDEATSALDGLTEQEVMGAIDALQGQRTIILIAHRLTTVKNCDAIFEFEAGRVVRSGTYEELLRSSERFRRMAGVSEAPTAAA